MRLLPPGPDVPGPLRWISNAIDVAIVILGAALVLVVFANVILHAFSKDIAWTTEFGELVMVWTTFLGVTAGIYRNAHMAVSELVDLLPERSARRFADALIQLVVAILLVLLVWKGGVAANASWGNMLTVLDWPMAIQYLALPFCSALALPFVVWDLMQIVRGVPRERRYSTTTVGTA